MTCDFSTFMNANRTLWNIEWNKLEEAFPRTPEGAQEWEEFVSNPHRYIANCGDEKAIMIWNAMCERDNRLKPTTLEQYAASFGFTFTNQS